MKWKILIGLIIGLILVGGLYFIFGNKFKNSQNQRSAQAEPIKVAEINLDNFTDGSKTLSKIVDSTKEPEKETIYTSPEIKTDFSFNAIGTHFLGEKPRDSAIDLAMRIYTDQSWTDWISIDFEDMEAKQTKSDETFGSIILTKNARAFQYQVKLKNNQIGESPQIEQIKFTYFDSISKKIKLSFNIPKAQAQEVAAGPSIYSREQWGADPNLMTWSPEYATVNKFIIHHTVTANISNPTFEQSAASMRAIYYYDSVTRGWGDIGYNYLIDQAGRIFEGRYGGNAVVGAHALGYNYGSVGISILGDYTKTDLSVNSSANLEKMIAWKSFENNIYPSKVYGHRDVNATACPGDGIYKYLGDIANNARNQVWNYYKLGQVSGDPKVYFLDKIHSTRIWIPSSASFSSLGFSFDMVAEITSEELATFTELNLVKGAELAIYRLFENKKYWIVDWSSFQAWGYTLNSVSFVSNLLLNGFPNGGNIGWIVGGTDKIYLIDQGAKHWIINWPTYVNWGFTLANVYWLPDSLIDTAPDGQNLYQLANSGSAVYALDRGYKRRIFDVETFNAWGFSWDQISALSNFILASRPSGPDINCLAADQTPKIYLLEGGYKHWFPNWSLYQDWGLGLSDFGWGPDNLLAAVPEGPQLGRLIKDTADGPVYLLSGGQKHRFPSDEILASWGFTKDQAILAPSIISNRPIGQDVTILPLANGRVYLMEGGYKRHLANMKALLGWNYFGTQIFDVSWGMMTTIPDKDEIYFIASLNDKLYLLDQGKRRWIPDMETAIAWDGSDVLNRVTPVTDDFINQYSTLGDNVTRLVKGNIPPPPRIYLMEGGYKRWITDWNSYLFYELSMGSYSEYSDALLSYIPEGPPISYPYQIIITANGAFNIVEKGVGTVTIVNSGTARATYVSAVSRYAVSVSNGYFGSFLNPIQFVPIDPSIIMEVSSYYDPNYNNTINFNKFRGLIELVYSPISNRVWIVEEVPLEDYLKGIAEEPNNYPAEFLKTMAVAERSYVYYHWSHGGKYPGEPYQIKNSRQGNGNDQVYAGYNFEVQGPNISAAVNLTAGQAVTYGGNPVITPYFSRSDGRTRSAQEVWAANWPWCQSVSDPWWWNGSSWQYGGTRSLLGHGVGLSAQGARGFIENNGWTYSQTLGYYYTGTGLGIVGNPNIRVAIYSVSP